MQQQTDLIPTPPAVALPKHEPSHDRLPWTCVMFTSREEPACVLAGLEAILVACREGDRVEIEANGDAAKARAIAAGVMQGRLSSGHRRASVRVWYIVLADKAHAWNEYLHRLWLPHRGVVFFVDGYVRVDPDALSRMAEALRQRPEALAATGVPTQGWSARRLRDEMLRRGGAHGNLMALTGDAIDALRCKGFRLPLGLYRTDATLAAALAFGFDPAHLKWDLKRRIAVVEGATWQVERKSFWHLATLRSHWQRLGRQAQGMLENLAVAHFYSVRRQPIESLPATAADLVAAWARASPEQYEKALKSWRVRRAFEVLTAPRDWSYKAITPALLADIEV